MNPEAGTKGLNFAILASAGTGKTYQLSVRLARLLMLGKRPEEIIALTFTRAAAGEFYLRVLQRLKEAATDEAKRLAICGVHPAGEPSPVDQDNPLVLDPARHPPAASSRVKRPPSVAGATSVSPVRRSPPRTKMCNAESSPTICAMASLSSARVDTRSASGMYRSSIPFQSTPCIALS